MHRKMRKLNRVTGFCEAIGLQVQSFTDGVDHTMSFLQEPAMNELIRTIESLVILQYQLARARNSVDKAVALVACVKGMGHISFTQECVGAVSNVLAMWQQLGLDDMIFVQGVEDYFSYMRKVLDNYAEVKQSPFAEKLYKFYMYLLSMSLFEKVGLNFDTINYTRLEKEVIRKQYHLGPDFIHCMLDTTLFLCERGYQCMKTGTLDPIYHGGSSYEKWMNKCYDLKRQAAFLSNPEAVNIDKFKFYADLHESIDEGEAILKHVSRLGVFERKVVASILGEIKMIKATEMTKRAAMRERKAPFAVLLSGGSSVAKSVLSKVLYYHFGKVFDLPTGSEYMYTRNPIDQYWVNFNSTQWCVRLDDIAFMHPTKAMQGDPSVMEMIQVINNVPFVPVQADLADKGKTPMLARLVIATTNTENLNAFHYFSCPLAVQRRLPWVVDVKPKREYSSDGVTLDSSLVPPTPDGEYPNYWILTVKKVIPESTSQQVQKAQYKVIAQYDNIYDFLAWYTQSAKTFHQYQEQAVDVDERMSKIDLCKKCYAPTIKCGCNLVQFGPLDIQAAEMVVAWSWQNYIFAALLACITTTVFYCSAVMFVFKYLRRPRLVWRMIKCWMAGDSLMRLCIRTCGDAVRDRIGCHTYALQVAALISGGGLVLTGIYHLVKSTLKSEEVQAEEKISSETIGKAPVPGDNERNNVWQKNDFEVTTFDVSPCSISWKRMTQDEVIKRLSRNLVTIKARWHCAEGTRVRETRAVCVTGNLYLCNKHSLPLELEQFEIEMIADNSKEGISPNVRCVIHASDICYDHQRDLALFKFMKVPPKKDIRELFVRPSMRGNFKGVYISRNDSGEICTSQVENISLTKDFSIPNIECVSDVWMGRVKTPTVLGDCGSIMVAFTEYGPTILGIHVVGNQAGVVGALSVTCDDLKEYASYLCVVTVQAGEPKLSSASATRVLGALHRKSPIRYLPRGVANVYGSFEGFRPKNVSRVKHTLICENLLKRGYEVCEGPPVMSGWEPWYNAIKDMITPISDFNTEILDECVATFATELCDALTPADWAEVMVYDNMTAINGAPGVTYVDKLNRNTSAGNPWKKSKKYFLLDMDPVGEYLDPVTVTDEILDRVDDIIKTYHCEKRWMPVFCGHLKDEARSWKKIESKQTRVFTGAPMDWSIVVRKYYLSVIRVMQLNRFKFEAAPGTIAQSLEWEEIMEYLNGFDKEWDEVDPPNKVFGDYKAYDKKMPPQFILGAFQIMIAICKHAGYSDLDLRVCWGIAYDTAYPLVDFNGDLIEFFGTNPSGHPLTVIVNSLANSLYFRYAYMVLNPEKEVESFKENVRLITYGDDNGAGVSKRAPWFNHTSIQKCLSEIGLTYTMADKEAASIPYIRLSECSFLKRTWRWDEDIGAFVCPLEHSSINKMLTVCVSSKTISREAQAVAVLGTATREYFWYGRAVFEEKRTMLMQVALEADLDFYLERATFPTWHHLFNEFWRASECVTLARKFERPIITKLVKVEAQPLPFTIPEPVEYLESNFEIQSGKTTTQKELQGLVTGLYKPKEHSINDLEIMIDSLLSQCALVEEHLPGRSPKPLFRGGLVSDHWSQNLARGLGEPVVKNKSPAQFLNKEEKVDMLMSQNFEVQVDEELEDLLHLSDRALGALVRRTWVRGHYVKFKRMLAKARAESLHVDVHTWTREEQMKLLHDLEASLAEENIVMQPDPRHPAPAGSPQTVFGAAARQPSATSLDFEIQADEYIEGESGGGAETGLKIGEEKQQNVQFNDTGLTTGFEHVSYAPVVDVTPNVELADFLSRPVLIKTFNMQIADSRGLLDSVNPWSAYFGTAEIQRKLHNYAFLRCDLKLKFVMNASPFYYGAYMAVYQPLAGFYTNTIAGSVNLNLVQYSQRPHMWLMPQDSTGGEMVLPFFYHKNWLEATSASTLDSFGTLSFVNYASLASANGVASDTVPVQVFAWAENVTLMGPTSSLAVQSKETQDEYGVGPISRPASAVATIARKLDRVPIIGPYARASGMIAEGVGRFAHLFGFSNVPDITPVKAFKPNPFPNMASSEISTHVEPLGIDPKTELSIDPRTVGLSGEDELGVSHFVKRESYIGNSIFYSSNIVGDFLFVANVHPCIAVQRSLGASTQYVTTPMGHVSGLFNAWRGDVIFKFTVIATKFHKGRLKITYDPVGNISGSTPSFPTAFSYVWDISERKEVEVTVPFNQATAWLRSANVTNTSANASYNNNSSGITHSDGFDNGTLTVTVLNTLSAPVSTSNVAILVSMRGGDNMEFAYPVDPSQNVSIFSVQARDEVEYECEEIVAGTKKGFQHPQRYLMNYGENIVSLRQLLRRANFINTWPIQSSGTVRIYCSNTSSLYPPYFGYDPNGAGSAAGLNTPGSNFSYTFSKNTVYNWLGPCFIGQRGGVVWHYNVDNTVVNQNVCSVVATRNSGVLSANLALKESALTPAPSGASVSKKAYYNMATRGVGAIGQSLVNQNTQTGVSVLVPFYSRYNFHYTNPSNSVLGSSTDGTDTSGVTVTASVNGTNGNIQWIAVDRYFNIGPDFTFFFFLNVPAWWSISSVTPN